MRVKFAVFGAISAGARKPAGNPMCLVALPVGREQHLAPDLQSCLHCARGVPQHVAVCYAYVMSGDVVLVRCSADKGAGCAGDSSLRTKGHEWYRQGS
jgi:hypothetical protein